jgi:hypothetical protein
MVESSWHEPARHLRNPRKGPSQIRVTFETLRDAPPSHDALVILRAAGTFFLWDGCIIGEARVVCCQGVPG